MGFYVFPLVVAAVGLSQTMIFLAAVPLIIFVAVLAARWDPKNVDIEAGSVSPAAGAASPALAPRQP